MSSYTGDGSGTDKTKDNGTTHSYDTLKLWQEYTSPKGETTAPQMKLMLNYIVSGGANSLKFELESSDTNTKTYYEAFRNNLRYDMMFRIKYRISDVPTTHWSAH